MSLQNQNLQIARDAYACFDRGELEGFAASFTPETEIHEVASMPYGGIYKGKEGFLALIGKVLEVFSTLNFTVHNIIANDDNAVAWGVLDLTSKNTGKSASVPMVEIWTMVDGKTRKLQVIYGDTAMALRTAELM